MATGSFHGYFSTEIRVDGTRIWYKDGKKHRYGDLPAVISTDGTRRWYLHGKQHRGGDLPASIWADDSQFWYLHGKKHRRGDLPAEIWADGTQLWFKYGKLHRDGDLPAVITMDGLQKWYKDGKKVSTGMASKRGGPRSRDRQFKKEEWVGDRRVGERPRGFHDRLPGTEETQADTVSTLSNKI